MKNFCFLVHSCHQGNGVKRRGHTMSMNLLHVSQLLFYLPLQAQWDEVHTIRNRSYHLISSREKTHWTHECWFFSAEYKYITGYPRRTRRTFIESCKWFTFPWCHALWAPLNAKGLRRRRLQMPPRFLPTPLKWKKNDWKAKTWERGLITFCNAALFSTTSAVALSSPTMSFSLDNGI